MASRPELQTPLVLNRRRFLAQSAGGLGTIALAQLLGKDAAAEPGAAAANLAARLPHFAPKAKNVIFLFQAGAPSQLDLFDPKPQMQRLHGEPVPPSFLEGLNDSLVKGSARVWASPRTFSQHGQCGMDFSDYLPRLATCADDLCMLRGVHTETSNHDPAQLFMNCGVPRFGAPSLGAWVTYGLGSQSQNLPGFVVLLSNNGPGDLAGTALWDNAFLPPAHRGVTFRNHGDAILHLASPPGFDRSMQRQRLDAINDLNRRREASHPDPQIASRIEAYELAFRMQIAAPELVDFSQETAATLDAYGIAREPTHNYGANCLLARRMVERGVRFVQLYHFTWDDHADLNAKLKNNCDRTDGPAAALIADLKQRGLLDETLVVWGGEFGRTPMNEVRRGITPGKEGRDHHPYTFTMLMAGGGIKPGTIIGRTDELGYHPVEDAVHVHDVQATLLHCLGLDHTKLTYRYQGRDHRLTDVGGHVIAKAFGS
ncbi:MAG: DUF1501 domain-containing protein [Planctomycetaceae bacterium]|nr:DUF1501 domain-containing protein [Planctomycetaceae bacterium]